MDMCSRSNLEDIQFSMYRIYPSVERLQIHLQNQHQVRFRRQQPIENIFEQNKKTMLTEFFTMNIVRPHDTQAYLGLGT